MGIINTIGNAALRAGKSYTRGARAASANVLRKNAGALVGKSTRSDMARFNTTNAVAAGAVGGIVAGRASVKKDKLNEPRRAY